MNSTDKADYDRVGYWPKPDMDTIYFGGPNGITPLKDIEQVETRAKRAETVLRWLVAIVEDEDEIAIHGGMDVVLLEAADKAKAVLGEDS